MRAAFRPVAAVFEMTPPSIPGTHDTRSEQAPNLVSAAPNPRRLYELAPAANSRVSPSLLELAFLGCHWSLRIVLARGTIKPSCAGRLVGLPVEPCLSSASTAPGCSSYQVQQPGLGDVVTPGLKLKLTQVFRISRSISTHALVQGWWESKLNMVSSRRLSLELISLGQFMRKMS